MVLVDDPPLDVNLRDGDFPPELRPIATGLRVTVEELRETWAGTARGEEKR